MSAGRRVQEVAVRSHLAALAVLVLASCSLAYAEPDAATAVAFTDGYTPHADGPVTAMSFEDAVENRGPSGGLHAVEVTHDGTLAGSYQYTIQSDGHVPAGRYDVHLSTEFGTSGGNGTPHPGYSLQTSDGAYVVMAASAAAVAAAVVATRGRRCGHACPYPHPESEPDPGCRMRRSWPSGTPAGGISGTEVIILDSSAIVAVMKTRLGMHDGRTRPVRAAGYLYRNLGRVCVTKAGSREQRPAYMGRLRHLRPEYDRTFKGCERRVDHGSYAGYQSLLDDAVDRLSDDAADGWICAKLRSLQRLLEGGAGGPGLRGVLDGADLDVRESRIEAENRILDSPLRAAARDLLASEVRRRDTAIAAQAAAIAGSGDAILVSDDYDIHTLLAGPLRSIAPRMRVMSLQEFDALC